MQAREHLDVFVGENVGSRTDKLAGLDQPALQAQRSTVDQFSAAAVVPAVALGLACAGDQAAGPLDELITAVDTGDHLGD